MERLQMHIHFRRCEFQTDSIVDGSFVFDGLTLLLSLPPQFLSKFLIVVVFV